MSDNSQLDSLTGFLNEFMPARAMQSFTSEMANLKTIPAAKELGLGQVRLSVIRYDAELIWERFPYRECDPRLLMALLEVWLAAGEEKRELFGRVGITNADPDWDIELIDEETAIVAVTVPMAEALIIVPDEAGNIPYQGGRYRLANAEIWTALSALVYAPGGDVPGVAE
ncbi:phage tail protein [Pantoea sp. PNT02]|uniref:phage tail protein n=1 Tax=Pantoea sp. PNT02 TaxID=2769261 RepID=UPI0017841B30|nr:phage tail protein [Pantoea sp. PNT02]MBD9643612.1 phage tail protein [Pantoea sp. PNT02]